MTRHETIGGAPFDTGRADDLLGRHGIDVMLAGSPHAVRYLMGGHRFFFFQAMEATGHSRYLPLVVYPAGRADAAAYVGAGMERWDHETRPFWTPSLRFAGTRSVDAAAEAAKAVRDLGLERGTIGVEMAFLPADAFLALKEALPEARFADVQPVLERLRAIKRPDELDKVRRASDLIVDAMQATMHGAAEGTTKREVAERLRREEVQRGLWFDYCLITMGAESHRSSSDRAWRRGDHMSLDSGGNFEGYIGDLCRMAVLGPPDAELVDLLAEIDATQQAVVAATRAGVSGREVLERANRVRGEGPNAGATDLVIHGMGLVSHEVPFLMDTNTYRGEDADAPLEAGMVLSVETTMHHPSRGFVKLEDTLIVTDAGCEMAGAGARDWTVVDG